MITPITSQFLGEMESVLDCKPNPKTFYGDMNSFGVTQAAIYGDMFLANPFELWINSSKEPYILAWVKLDSPEGHAVFAEINNMGSEEMINTYMGLITQWHRYAVKYGRFPRTFSQMLPRPDEYFCL